MQHYKAEALKYEAMQQQEIISIISLCFFLFFVATTTQCLNIQGEIHTVHSLARNMRPPER